MKKPNGYGTIKRLSGNRRRPFVFVISECGKQRPIEYFSSLIEAEIYQADYNKQNNNYVIKRKITFSEVYNRWLKFHVDKFQPAQSTVSNYHNAYNHCRHVWYMDIKEIKYSHLQLIIDRMLSNKLSYSSAKKVRSLISLVFKYAIMNKYCSANYANLLHLGKNKPVYPHRDFTRQKINKLWSIVDTVPFADTVLMLIYSGMRVGELLSLEKANVNIKSKYFNITKSKTKSGIRIIPIHKKIYPLVILRYSESQKYLLEYNDKPISYSCFRGLFKRVMKSINGKYRPHDTRHTTATLLDNKNVNPNAKRRILGHAGTNVTDGVYTHKNLRQLRKAIDKID